MKKIILTLFQVLVVSACTSEEGKLKQLAIDSATQQFRSELKEEISKGVSEKLNLQATAVDIVTKRTEFEVLKSEVRGKDADVEVLAKTIPAKVKTSLIEIIARLDPRKERNLNVSDAIDLISQQMGISSDERATLVYRFKFKNKGSWQKQEPP